MGLFKSQRGSALIGLLVIAGVLGIVVMVVSQTFKFRSTLLSQVRIEGEMADVRRFVQASVALPFSAGMAGRACAGYVPLYGRILPAFGNVAVPIPTAADLNAMVVVKANGTTTIGQPGAGWTIRASCAMGLDPLGTGLHATTFTLWGLKHGETTWRQIPQGTGLTFVWPTDMWNTTP